MAAEVGRLGGGVGAPGVEGGGLERADGHPAGHGVTQERAVEEEPHGKGGSGSEGKFGKGGSQEAGIQDGLGVEGKGWKSQVPVLAGVPPGFDGKQFGALGYQAPPAFSPYPPRALSLEDLFAEVRAGNTNVNVKFAVLQNQFSTVQQKLEKIEAEGIAVHTKQFDTLQVQVESVQARVAKMESGAGVSSQSPDLQALYNQLNRLDPANKSLAIHGFGDNDLRSRVDYLNKILRDNRGTCLPVRIEHVHKGKRDERVPTKVSLIEFGSNADRETVFKIFQGLELTDNSGAKVVCKRAKTALQKQRNDNLIKAEGLIKAKALSGATVKIEWEKREVNCNGETAFSQCRDSASGEFKAPFQALTV